ncbi:MAG: AIR synthase related protein, partial [Pseudomonadota bacterium]
MGKGSGNPGEFELIRMLTKGVPREADGLICGVGDDCAVIAGPGGKDWLVTTDALVEGVHFRREWADPAVLGRKALAVNLSDIAAMGG